MNFSKDTIRRTKISRGYTLLFAVIVSVLVLSIAAFILSVSRKQAIYAFYAADSGLECAVENLTANLATSTFTSPSDTHNITCGNSSFAVSLELRQNPSANAGMTTFSMSTGGGASNSTQSGASSCAIVTVDQYKDASLGIVTNIISKGYNIGWTGSACTLPGPRKVERALQYTLFNN
jgi:hypothetical protein